MHSDDLHFDGGMIAGGGSYFLRELDGLGLGRRWSSGLEQLDGGRGLRGGEIWVIAHQDRAGGTALALHLAVHAASTGRVLVVNGHLATRDLHRRIRGTLERYSDADERAARIAVASWMGVPRREVPLGRDMDVVVYDTFDENFSPGGFTLSRRQDLAFMREFRAGVRSANIAVVLTARVPTPRGPSPEVAFWKRWSRHWASEAFADIADVALYAHWDDRDQTMVVDCHRRAGGFATQRFIAVPDGGVHLMDRDR